MESRSEVAVISNGDLTRVHLISVPAKCGFPCGIVQTRQFCEFTLRCPGPAPVKAPSMRHTLNTTTATIAAIEIPSDGVQYDVAPPPRVPGLRTNPEDAALEAAVIAIGSGNRAALAVLYDATALRIYGIARSALHCPWDAEEIVGDVFMYVWQNAHRYDAGRGAVMGWLTMITRNRSIDRFRLRRSMVSIDDETTYAESRTLTANTESPDQFLARFEETALVYRVLALQSPLRRRLIELAFLRGLCHEDIAMTTGLPLGTVKSHIRRTLIRMRTTLQMATNTTIEGCGRA